MFLVQPFTSPPRSTLEFSVPPSLMYPVAPPPLAELLKAQGLVHVRPAEPYPKPKPIQNPSRVCGCCACATDVSASAKPAANARHRAVARMTASFMGISAGTRLELKAPRATPRGSRRAPRHGLPSAKTCRPCTILATARG